MDAHTQPMAVPPPRAAGSRHALCMNGSRGTHPAWGGAGAARLERLFAAGWARRLPGAASPGDAASTSSSVGLADDKVEHQVSSAQQGASTGKTRGGGLRGTDTGERWSPQAELTLLQRRVQDLAADAEVGYQGSRTIITSAAHLANRWGQHLCSWHSALYWAGTATKGGSFALAAHIGRALCLPSRTLGCFVLGPMRKQTMQRPNASLLHSNATR